MQFEVVFLLLFGFCCSKPHEGLPLLNPGGIGGIFEGPGSETIIRGPDGSEITSEQKGGAVIQDDGFVSQPIIVAEPEIAVASAPILADDHLGPIIASTGAPILASAPILPSASPALLTGETYDVDYIDAPLAASAAPVVASLDVKPIEIVQQDPHIIETEIIEAPDVEPDQSSDLKGPSGRIITKGSASIVSGPASTTITEPRKIIVAPPKIAIETPVIATATIPLNEASLVQESSSLAPPLLSYSTTSAGDLGYSTSGASLVSLPDSSRINLGAGSLRESIPVVEYSSSNGVVNGQNLGGVIDATQSPIISSTISAITTDRYAPSTRPAVPAAYLLAPEGPANLAPTAAGLVSSTGSANIQRIPRIEDNIDVDGRVDMEYSLSRKSPHESYQLPQVLGMALSRLYRKTPVKNKDRVVIDDKMGELAQNEIASYDSSASFVPPPDLSQAQYIAPALARNGIDSSQVNLASVPLSQVTRLPDELDGGYLTNRYARNALKRN